MDPYYLGSVVLKRTHFSKEPDKRKNLHYAMCLIVLKDGLKEGIEIPRDHLKMLSLDTRIPTPKGWKTMEDIHPGDLVYAADGTQTKVIAESEIFENEQCFEITFSTGEKVIAGADHQWLVDDHKIRANHDLKYAPCIKTTKEMFGNYIFSNHWDEQRQKNYPEYRYRISKALPVQNQSYNFPVHPYVIGAWLGDGSKGSGGLTSGDEDISNIIRSLGYSVIKSNSQRGQQYHIHDIIKDLRSEDILNFKRIPEEYLGASESERMFLFQGLMDTDGTVNREGQCSFTSSRCWFIQQVRTLGCSLGYKISPVGTYQAFSSKDNPEPFTFYSFTFYATTARSPFLLSRKTARLKDKQKTTDSRQIVQIKEVPSVPTKCIAVEHPEKLYLITEGYIPTHNSTVYSEVYPIFRALPFGPPEEDFFSTIGFSDLFIEWMRRTHSQDIRILIVSETIKNAIKLGGRIANHYENNDLFRKLFHDILPTERETWTAESLHQRRTPSGSGHGEGTFDFIGVGVALQSRHYNLVIQDDLIGREARKSRIVMQDAIDYHQILAGATDFDIDNPGRDFDEIVVGNRWSHDDLNSYIRKEERYFSWTTHSALGGCCSLHPLGTPIFPEAFTRQKLMRWKQRLGTYHFSCQFLNLPINPAKKKFNISDFRYFNFERTYGALSIPKEQQNTPWHKAPRLDVVPSAQYRTTIRHHVAEGDVEEDVFPRYLDRYLITDPNHGGEHPDKMVKAGSRARHAILVIGISENPRRIYILDQWAEACKIGKYVEKILFYTLKWKLRRIHCEEEGGQKYLVYHLNYFIAENSKDHPDLAGVTLVPLKSGRRENAKEERIDNTIPMVERHEVWLDANNCSDFREEAEKYGQIQTTVDLLDCFGFVPQLAPISVNSEENIEDFLNKQRKAFARRMASVA
jgi:hypothetical protein